jgi:hypothetical protein
VGAAPERVMASSRWVMSGSRCFQAAIMAVSVVPGGIALMRSRSAP